MKKIIKRTYKRITQDTVPEAGVSYNFRFYSNGTKGLKSDKTEAVSVLVS